MLLGVCKRSITNSFANKRTWEGRDKVVFGPAAMVCTSGFSAFLLYVVMCRCIVSKTVCSAFFHHKSLREMSGPGKFKILFKITPKLILT